MDTRSLRYAGFWRRLGSFLLEVRRITVLRLVGTYFAIQGVAIIGWWLVLWVEPGSRELFLANGAGRFRWVGGRVTARPHLRARRRFPLERRGSSGRGERSRGTIR